MHGNPIRANEQPRMRSRPFLPSRPGTCRASLQILLQDFIMSIKFVIVESRWNSPYKDYGKHGNDLLLCSAGMRISRLAGAQSRESGLPK